MDPTHGSPHAWCPTRQRTFGFRLTRFAEVRHGAHQLRLITTPDHLQYCEENAKHPTPREGWDCFCVEESSRT